MPTDEFGRFLGGGRGFGGIQTGELAILFRDLPLPVRSTGGFVECPAPDDLYSSCRSRKSLDFTICHKLVQFFQEILCKRCLFAVEFFPRCFCCLSCCCKCLLCRAPFCAFGWAAGWRTTVLSVIFIVREYSELFQTPCELWRFLRRVAIVPFIGDFLIPEGVDAWPMW